MLREVFPYPCRSEKGVLRVGRLGSVIRVDRATSDQGGNVVVPLMSEGGSTTFRGVPEGL